MTRQDNSDQEMSRTTKSNMESRRKKPYRSPRLVVYGDLSRVTKGGGGTKGDGGGTHSKA